MAFGSYNNNSGNNGSNSGNGPINNTYSPISFSNLESAVAQTRFGISYFNRLMVISIAERISNRDSDYPSFDMDNAAKVYMSASKAKVLLDLIAYMKENPEDVHNVCVEMRTGLLKVSDGSEYGINNWCVSISFANGGNGRITEAIYEFKNNTTGAYNYNTKENTYDTKVLPTIEFDTFVMTLEQYYIASSYAIAASVMEASMYKREYISNIIKEIAKANNISTGFGNKNSYTFLNGGNGNNNNGGNSNGVGGAINAPVSGLSNEYEQSTFDQIASGM